MQGKSVGVLFGGVEAKKLCLGRLSFVLLAVILGVSQGKLHGFLFVELFWATKKVDEGKEMKEGG